MQANQVDRYVKLLGLRRRTPSLSALQELVQAHLNQVPFENISKLYYRRRLGLRGLPGVERFLDGIERFHFGGTCYPNNYYLGRLLAGLGYAARLCGADMSEPDVHLVIMVELDGREYLVDAGYAAPFASPLPLDCPTPREVLLGRDRYVLEPRDAMGCSRVSMYREGTLTHGYRAKPEPREIDEFESVIADSYADEATFMNAILLARFFPGGSLVVDNLTVIESRGASTATRTVAERDELVEVIAGEFGIPPEITSEALKELTSLTSRGH